MLTINPLKLAPYYSRSNGLVERFIDKFKRAIKKANGIEAENGDLQEFLSINGITPNPNSNANMSSSRTDVCKEIRSVFDELIPSKKGNKKKKTSNNTYSPREKFYFLNCHFGKATWLEGIIEKTIGNMMYIIKHPKSKVRRHINQIKKIYPKRKGTS